MELELLLSLKKKFAIYKNKFLRAKNEREIKKYESKLDEIKNIMDRYNIE